MFAIKPIVRVLALGIAAYSFNAVAAENDSQPPTQATWHVSRFSGAVWLVAPGVQQASLNQEAALNPGDTIRTGPNGRVLLTRGTESMMIAPNSVIGLPAQAKDGMSTTIAQQAGSILLDVEKRNVQHFAVETPYLAAVVKGTQFRVTVTASGANVMVARGQVEVADFKSGEIAQVLPGQTAKVVASSQGLSLSGSGSFLPIEHGQPRAPSVDKVTVPRGGFTAPRAVNGLRVVKLNRHSNGNPNPQALAKHDGGPGRGAIRISTALGDVKLNFSKVTHGIARGIEPSSATRSHGDKETVWKSNASTVNASNAGNSTAVTAVTTAMPTPAAAAIASSNGSSANAFNLTSASSNQGNGNGNGNAAIGNGSGNANGGNGNGNAANGNGGNGNGNQASNNGIGNGHGRGHR